MLAGWFPDPTGRAEQRYFDGETWTEHIVRGGQQMIDRDHLVAAAAAPTSPENPDMQDRADADPAERSHAATDQPAAATDPAAANPLVVEAGPATSPLQQPSSTRVLWEGQRESLTAAASQGRLVKARYRLTEDAIQFEAGLLSTKAEVIPLWTVIDVDLSQSMMQKARGVGDVTVHLEDTAERLGQSKITLESVKEPRSVRDLIASKANGLRIQFTEREHRLEVERRTAAAGSINIGSAPPSAAGTSPGRPEPVTTSASSADDHQVLLDQLRQLAELRDGGILSEEEFQAQKARMLGQ